MREVKFRGNSLETKEQVFGHLFYFDDGRCFISPKGTIVEGDKGQHPDEYYLRGLKCIEVELESVCEYTGLKDKNGVEIYEGDVVRHSRVASDISIVKFGEFGVPNIEEMTYQDNAMGFYYENASTLKDVAPFNMTIPLNKEYVRRDEIIGNIYENPELLKQEG